MHAHLARGVVDAQRAGSKVLALAGLALPPAQGGADASQQFSQHKGLVDIIICPQIQRSDLLGFLMAGRNHDDRHAAGRANGADDVLAIHIGQAKIKQHQIRFAHGQIGQRLVAVHSHGHAMAQRLQHRTKRGNDPGFIINKQDMAAIHQALSHARIDWPEQQACG